MSLPPVISIEETITFVAKEKNIKVKCAVTPHLILITCKNVAAFGACIFNFAAF